MTGPTNLTSVAIRGGVKLTWDNVANNHGYEIYGNINGAGYNLLGSVNPNVCTYNDMRSGGTISMAYKVRAKSATDSTGFTSSTLTSITITWVDDYAKIDFTDSVSQTHEIWESKDGGVFSLVTTLAAGILTYNNKTWQNANVRFMVKGANGSAILKDYTTPLVFKTDQTILKDVVFNVLSISSGALVIDWGDGTHTDWTNTSDSTGLTKTYSTEGIYYVVISGDTNLIRYFVFEYVIADVNRANYATLDKWVLPTSLINFHYLYQKEKVTGDITNLTLPTTLQIFDVQDNALTGNIPKTYPSVMTICHYADNDLSGDLTGLVLFSPSGYSSQNVFDIQGNSFTGDLSSTNIPLNLGRVGLGRNQFTKLPRGHFANCTSFGGHENLINTAELDSFLAYVDAYFTGGVVPLRNAVYQLDGTGNGIPSAAGLASRTSIINKYVAEGKTCTISVNS